MNPDLSINSIYSTVQSNSLLRYIGEKALYGDCVDSI